MTTTYRYTAALGIALGLLAAGVVASDTDQAPAPQPVTTADPSLPSEELALLLKPLTKDQLLIEAQAWQSLVQEKAEEIALAEVAIIHTFPLLLIAATALGDGKTGARGRARREPGSAASGAGGEQLPDQGHGWLDRVGRPSPPPGCGGRVAPAPQTASDECVESSAGVGVEPRRVETAAIVELDGVRQ